MSKKRHRGSSKIKYEHHMVAGLRGLLEEIQDWPEIQSIIPGAIHRRAGAGGLRLMVQRETSTGLRCLAKSGGAVQEVFITSERPDLLKARLIGRGGGTEG